MSTNTRTRTHASIYMNLSLNNSDFQHMCIIAKLALNHLNKNHNELLWNI